MSCSPVPVLPLCSFSSHPPTISVAASSKTESYTRLQQRRATAFAGDPANVGDGEVDWKREEGSPDDAGDSLCEAGRTVRGGSAAGSDTGAVYYDRVRRQWWGRGSGYRGGNAQCPALARGAARHRIKIRLTFHGQEIRGRGRGLVGSEEHKMQTACHFSYRVCPLHL